MGKTRYFQPRNMRNTRNIRHWNQRTLRWVTTQAIRQIEHREFAFELGNLILIKLGENFAMDNFRQRFASAH